MLSAAVFNTLNAVKELIRRYLGVITANTLLHRERRWSGASALVISPTRGSLGPRERGNREREGRGKTKKMVLKPGLIEKLQGLRLLIAFMQSYDTTSTLPFPGRE